MDPQTGAWENSWITFETFASLFYHNHAPVNIYLIFPWATATDGPWNRWKRPTRPHPPPTVRCYHPDPWGKAAWHPFVGPPPTCGALPLNPSTSPNCATNDRVKPTPDHEPPSTEPWERHGHHSRLCMGPARTHSLMTHPFYSARLGSALQPESWAAYYVCIWRRVPFVMLRSVVVGPSVKATLCTIK